MTKFKVDVPEPYASLVDILTSSQYLELAIHAKDKNTTVQNLNSAILYLKYAQSYFKTYNDKKMVVYLQSVINQLTKIKDNVPEQNLSDYQSKVIYMFQGNMSSLYRKVNKLWSKLC